MTVVPPPAPGGPRRGDAGALDCAAVVAWAEASVTSLQTLCAELDGMNVFPVADADTGSNMLHTLTAARDVLAAEAPDTAGAALRTLAGAAITAARGNSGVILSQLLLGMAKDAGDTSVLDGRSLAGALGCADRTATDAVVRPVEGTMLSVLRAAADGARAAAHPEEPVTAIAQAAAEASAQALARTPEQLPVLAEAGVVDAGGRGVLALLDELAAVLSGVPAPDRPEFRLTPRVRPVPASGGQPWEVMYLLDDVAPDAAAALRQDLGAIGDSVTIAVDGAGSHAVHVHCADIGAALDAGLRAGRPHQVRVESLTAEPRSGRTPSAILAIVAGEELVELCRQEGICVLGGDSPPTAQELARAVADLDAAHVTVLPGSKELTTLAESVSTAPGDSDVVVIPCASPVQVLAALAVYDADRRPADNVVAMAEAAAATRRGELMVAAGDAITWAGRASAGDAVGFVDDEVVLISPGSEPMTAAGTRLLDLMLSAGGELVTALLGAQAPDGIADALADHMAIAHPEVEFAVYPGGQNGSVLSMGVE